MVKISVSGAESHLREVQEASECNAQEPELKRMILDAVFGAGGGLLGYIIPCVGFTML